MVSPCNLFENQGFTDTCNFVKAKDKIRLTEKEYEDWTQHQIKIAHPEITTLSTEVKTRIVCNCLARDQSIQILGAVGVDLWASIAFIKIEGLVSMNDAIQIAVPVTLGVFREVLETQNKRIAARAGYSS
jgi:hypothetical protein